ncbi:MAG: hypothetical protein AAGB02_07175 [Pseudomonadota bacterium]
MPNIYRENSGILIRLLSILLTSFLLVACDGSGGGVLSIWNGSFFVKRHVEKPGYRHYRLQASYTVRETGEPIEFDFVVSCGAQVTHWRYTGPSTRVSTHPLAMVQPTSDGGAILMRTYRSVCENGFTRPRDGAPRVPDDLLPFIIWFDDVKDLSFGWGYATEDAYYNTNSKLIFNGASITEASFDDWKAWRAKAEAEYSQIGQLPGPWGYSYTNGPREHSAFVKSLSATGEDITNSCNGYVRVPAPKDLIEQIWAASPEYNFVSDDGRYLVHKGAWKWIRGIFKEAGPVFSGRVLNDHLSTHGGAYGAVNRNNSGYIRLSTTRNKVIADHYPFLPRSKSTATPITTPADAYPRRILVGEAWKGMIACGGDFFRPGPDYLVHKEFDRSRKITEQLVLIPEKSFDIDWKSKTFPLYINDQMVVENLRAGEYGGNHPNYYIIDREGYIFVHEPWGFGGI